MLAYIEGQIIKKSKFFVILKTNNLGYLIYLKEKDLEAVEVLDKASYYLHNNIKEDASDLYGFLDFSDLEMFKLLLSVSGIGPKSALSIMSLASTSDIAKAVSANEADILTKVSGVGKKTAERLVLELKNKLDSFIDHSQGLSEAGLAQSDELEALLSLGYSLNDARLALKSVDENIVDSSQRLKAALKNLSTNI